MQALINLSRNRVDQSGTWPNMNTTRKPTMVKVIPTHREWPPGNENPGQPEEPKGYPGGSPNILAGPGMLKTMRGRVTQDRSRTARPRAWSVPSYAATSSGGVAPSPVEGRRHDPCCASDGGRSSGFAVQTGSPSHRKLRRLRAGVASVVEKARCQRVRCATRRRTCVNHC